MTIARRGARRASELDQAWGACRATLWRLGLFSFGINLLVLAPSIYMLQIYDRVLTSGRVETLIWMTVLLAGALLLFGALDALRSVVLVRMSTWIGQQLAPVYLAWSVRSRLMGDMAGAQPLRDLAQVQSFLSSPALTVLFDAPWTPVFILLIWILHPWLGALALGAALLLLALGVLNEVVTRAASLRANVEQLATLQQAEATIRNAEVVRAMGMLPAMLQRWGLKSNAAATSLQNSSERGGLLLGLTKALRMFVQSAVLGLGAYLVLRNELTAGAMIASSILLGRALAPVEIAMSSWRNFMAARISLERLRSRADVMTPEPERTRLPTPLGFLKLRHVSYAPPGARTNTLHDVSFSVEPGEAVAVIGPSASGKTSLCRIITGIAAPGQGDVRIDGSELQHWRPEDLGRHIGYLPQDVELFAGTVRENIARMGAPDDGEVIAAARLAHAHDMIQKLPQGYDTQIGDGGARLSGGQRQRIGLARAVSGSPRLVILDEPNANLDQAGESALAAAIADLKGKGAALVIVGHRPSTLAQADKVLLLRDGRVEMFGSRQEVINRLRTSAAPARVAESADAEGRDASARSSGETDGEARRVERGGDVVQLHGHSRDFEDGARSAPQHSA